MHRHTNYTSFGSYNKNQSYEIANTACDNTCNMIILIFITWTNLESIMVTIKYKYNLKVYNTSWVIIQIYMCDNYDRNYNISEGTSDF